MPSLLDPVRNLVQQLSSLNRKQYIPIFVSGAGGSGTNLVSALLYQRCKACGIIPESPNVSPAGNILRVEKVSHFADLASYYAATQFAGGTTSEAIRRDYRFLFKKYTISRRTSDFIVDHAAVAHLVRATQLKAAFPSARFVAVIREPVYTLEGLKRKWPTFNQANLLDLCNFWRDQYERFIQASRVFPDAATFVLYSDIVAAPDEMISLLAARLGMEFRSAAAPLYDIPNDRGKGVRNIVNGVVSVVNGNSRHPDFALSEGDENFISGHLQDVYNRYKQMALRPRGLHPSSDKDGP